MLRKVYPTLRDNLAEMQEFCKYDVPQEIWYPQLERFAETVRKRQAELMELGDVLRGLKGPSSFLHDTFLLNDMSRLIMAYHRADTLLDMALMKPVDSKSQITHIPRIKPRFKVTSDKRYCRYKDYWHYSSKVGRYVRMIRGQDYNVLDPVQTSDGACEFVRHDLADIGGKIDLLLYLIEKEDEYSRTHTHDIHMFLDDPLLRDVGIIKNPDTTPVPIPLSRFPLEVVGFVTPEPVPYLDPSVYKEEIIKFFQKYLGDEYLEYPEQMTFTVNADHPKIGWGAVVTGTDYDPILLSNVYEQDGEYFSSVLKADGSFEPYDYAGDDRIGYGTRIVNACAGDGSWPHSDCGVFVSEDANQVEIVPLCKLPCGLSIVKLIMQDCAPWDDNDKDVHIDIPNESLRHDKENISYARMEHMGYKTSLDFSAFVSGRWGRFYHEKYLNDKLYKKPRDPYMCKEARKLVDWYYHEAGEYAKLNSIQLYNDICRVDTDFGDVCSVYAAKYALLRVLYGQLFRMLA